MIDVKKVISLINEIQESAAAVLDLRKSLDASYDKETMSISAESKKAIDEMKVSVQRFKDENFNSIKEKVHNQGKYQEAYDIFVQLGTYSDSATWAEKCDEKITEQNRLQSLNQFKEYLSFIGNNIPVPSKVEYWGTPGTGTTYYEGSYRNCVYGSGYIYNVANGLNFVSNYKDELIAAGYTEVTGGSHYNDCDYYYKKDNIVIGFNDPIDSYYEYYIYMVVLKVNEM